MQAETPLSTLTRLLAVRKKDRLSDEKNPSFSQQMMAHFVPTVSFFGREGVVEKQSLHGKISSFVNQRVSKSLINKRIRQVFARALAELIKTPKGLEGIEMSDRVCLLREFQSEDAIKALIGGSEEAHKVKNIELEVLEKEALKKREESEIAEIEELTKWSLLRCSTGAIVELSTFQELFTEGTSNSGFYNERLERFLTSYPDYAAPDWKHKQKRIQEGLSFREALFALVREEDSFKPENARLKVLRTAAKKLQEEVLNLSSSDSRWFCGSFGERHISLQKLLGAINNLPQVIRDGMPEALKNLAAKLTKKPQDLVDETVHEWIEKLKEQLDTQNDQGQLEFLNVLFPDGARQLHAGAGTLLPASIVGAIEARLQKGVLGNFADLLEGMLPDENRKLPEAITRWLPHVVQHRIENKLQGGLLEILAGIAKFSPSSQISDFLSVILLNKDLIETSQTSATLDLVGKLFWMWSFLPSEASLKILKWLAGNAHLLKDVKSRQEVQERIELEIRNWTQKPLKLIQESSDTTVSGIFNQLRSALKPEWLEFLGFDGSFAFGHLWLEFFKQPDGRFTVEIYSTGIALSKHPQNDEGKIGFPLRLVDIDPSKLNRDFFFKLLFHTIEPNCDENIRSSGADLFEFMTTHLKGKEDLRKAPAYRKLPLDIASDRDMSELCLTSESAAQGYANFVISLEALIDFCSPYLTGKNGTLEIYDPSVANALEAAIGVLGKRKETLVGVLAPDFTKKVEITTKEISRALQQFKIRTAASETRKNEIVPNKGTNPFRLPEELLQPVRTVFLKNHISEETILSYKPTLLWALGDELEDFIDALASTIGPLDESQKPVKRSVLTQVDATLKKGWLKEIIQGICFQSALAALKFAISAARLYQSGLPPIFILSSLNWAAHQVFPQVILDWYHQALGYLLRKSIEMTLNFALRLILNPAEIAQFKLFQNTWKTVLQKVTKQLMGTSEISYDLDRPLVAEPTLEPLAIAMDERGAKGTSTIQILYANVEQLLPQLSIPQAPMLPNSRVIQREINDWIRLAEIVEKTSANEALYYLCAQIERLKIPGNTQDDFWKVLKEAPECLEAFYALSVRLVELAEKLKNGFKLRDELFGLTVVSLYSLLAIIDCLVRQSSSSCFKGYKTNIYELLAWSTSGTGFLGQPSTSARLKQILEYFGVDTHYLPCAEEILKSGRESVFYYDESWVEDSIALAKHLPEVTILKEHLPKIDFEKELAHTAFTYESFLEIVEDPVKHKQKWEEVVKELWTRGLKSNLKFLYPLRIQKSFRAKLATEHPGKAIFASLLKVFKTPKWREAYPKLSQLLEGMFVTNAMSDLEKVEILFAESFVFERHFKSKLFPAGFIHLRFQVIVNSLFTKTDSTKRETSALKCAIKDSIFYFRPDNTIGRKIKNFLGIWPKRIPGRIRGKLSTPYYPLSFLPQEGARYLDVRARRTQSEIIEYNTLVNANASSEALVSQDPSRNDEYFRNLACQGARDWQTLEAIICEPKDACVRLLSYLEEHKDSLCNHPKLFEFFERLMFRPLALAEQLSQSPLSVRSVGEFLASQFTYHQAHDNLLVRIWLLTVGIKLRDCCQALGFETSNYFPSLKVELGRVKSLMEPIGARMFYHMMGALVSPFPLAQLGLEEQLDVACGLVLPLFCGNFFLRKKEFYSLLMLNRECDATFLESLVETYKIRYWRERETLFELLKDSSFASKLIQRVLKECKIAFGVDQSQWKLIGDLAYSNGTTTVDFINGLIKSENPFVSLDFLDAVKKWGIEVLKLPLNNPLLQDKEGNFRSLDGSVFVEVADFSKAEVSGVVFGSHRYRRFTGTYPETFPRNSEVWKLEGLFESSEKNEDGLLCAYVEQKLVDICPPQGWKKSSEAKEFLVAFGDETNDFGKKFANRPLSILGLSVSLKASRRLGETTYRFVPMEELLITPEFFDALNAPNCSPSDLAVWIEQTASPKRKVHLSPLGITKELSQPHQGIFRLPMVEHQQEALLEITGEKKADLIHSLERFCGRSQIQLFCRSGSKHIEKVVFTPFNLTFTVIEENGCLKAVNSQEFPGFHIAPIQDHKELNSFGNYLILVNAEGRHKVLIPDGQWISTLALRAVPLLGPLACLVVAKIDERNLETKREYHTFAMEGSGSLTTENPKSLIFLMALSLAANRSKEAERLCSTFELIAKRTKLSRKLIGSLLPLLLVPLDISGVVAIRRRLIVALEENFALHLSSTVETNSSDSFSELISCVTVLYDLARSTQKAEKPSSQEDFQDWLLFQYVFRVLSAQLRNLIDNRKDTEENESQVFSPLSYLTKLPWEVLKDMGDAFSLHMDKSFGHDDSLFTHYNQGNAFKFLGPLTNLAKIPLEILKNLADRFSLEMVLETLILPSHLDRRFEYLKKRFGKDDGALKKAIKFAFDVLKTPSGIPSLGVQLQQVIPQIEGAGSLQESLLLKGGTWLKEVGELYFNGANGLGLEVLFYAMVDSRDVVLKETDFDIKRLTAALFKRNFVAYYRIASQFRSTHQTAKLKELLSLMRGGWDAQTAVLVKYLSYISDPKYCLMFERVEVLLKAFNPEPSASVDAPFEIRYPKWIIFFNRLNKIVMTIEAAFKGLDIMLPRILDYRLQTGILRQLNGGQFSYNYNLKIPLLGFGVSTFRTLKSYYDERIELNQALRVVSSTNVQTSVFAAVQADDVKFDKFLRHKIFPLAFEFGPPVQWFDKEEKVTPFDVAKGGAVAERVNLSLDDHYASQDRIAHQIKLKSEEALWSVYVHLLEYSNGLRVALKAERERLLNSVNQGNTLAPITFEELTGSFLDGNFERFTKRLQLAPESICHLDLAVARDLARHLRLQQFERILTHFDAIASANKGSLANCEEQIEAIAEELIAERAYKFDQDSSRLTRRLMLFEYVTKKMLWEKQVKIITQLLLGKEPNVVVELLMSLGKTWYGVPTTNAFEADGTKIVFDIFPSAIAATNIRQIGSQARTIFNQTVNVLQFNRRQGLVKVNLDTVALILQRSMQQREIISMTREDIQALELMYLDGLHRLKNASTFRNYNSKNLILDVAKILQSVRRFGKVVGDEAHELLNHRQELNYPAGPHSTIRQSYYMVMEMCVRHFMQIPIVNQLVAENNLPKLLASEEQWLEVLNLLAVKMSGYKPFAFATPEVKRDFVHYVSGQTSTIPVALKTHPLFSEMALVKGMLGTLLPLTFARKVNVDFGASLEGNGEYARPYEGNTSPMEQASIRSPYEALTKTFVQFLHNGLSIEQFDCLVKTLLKKMHQEIKVRKVCAEETTAYKLFQSWSPGASLLAMESDRVSRASVAPTILRSTEAILLYIRYHVQKDIKYWKCNLRSGPQDFFSMFASGFFDTGTPYNFGTYPSKLKMQWDAGTIGRALDTIHKKCPQDGIHVLQASKPYAILNETLHRFFSPRSNFTALIDGSALLAGLSNHDVAMIMRQFVSSSRPDIKGIVYFHKGTEGKDELVCLEQGAEKPIPFDQSTLSPEQRLSYFDQRHGFAADIPQKNNAIGLNLIGNTLTLNRLMQEVFRMRGIKKWKKMGISDDLKAMNDQEIGTQTIQFAMTAEMKALLSPQGTPTLRDIMQFAISNEAKIAEKDNYESYRQKLTSLIRRAVMDKLEAVDSTDAMLALFEEFEHVLVQNVQDDPAHLFGYIEMEVDTLGEKGVLARLREEAYETISRSASFNSKEKEAIKREIEAIEIHAMPSTIKVPTDDGQLVLHVAEDLNKAVHHEVEIGTETTKEQENNRENELQNSVQNQMGGTRFLEWSWEGEFNPHAMTWMTFSSSKAKSTKIIAKHAASGLNFIKRMVGIKELKLVLPPLFKVEELLTRSAVEVMAQISYCFDSRLWFSNNFLPRHTSELAEGKVEIGETMQRDLYEVLVHYKEDLAGEVEFLSVGCLSIKDSVELRRRFNGAEPGTTKAFIYDVNARMIVAGHQMDLEVLRKHPDFILLEIQLKFLNGDVVYHQDQLKSLKKWMRRSDVHKLKEAFHYIHSNRGRREFYGSDMEQMILAAQNIPKEERF